MGRVNEARYSVEMFRIALALLSIIAATSAMSAVDLSALWDFSNPAASEQRFRDALKSAVGDERLIIQTQIARTHMLRKDFAAARKVLQAISSDVAAAGSEAKARYWLELGRSHASHRHDPATQTPESRRLAQDAFSAALKISREAKLDALTVDALHMFVFVETAPAEQLKWNEAALAVIAASEQPDARRWEASISSNAGEALYDLGRYDEALNYFRRALFLREQSDDPRGARDAYWHVARVLRIQNHVDDALAIQLRLEQESEVAQQPKDYIYEELKLLYQAKGDVSRALLYEQRAKALQR